MTDEQWQAYRWLKTWQLADRNAVTAELDRARASEVAKDAVIRALVDALEAQRSDMSPEEWHSGLCMDAGRASCTEDCIAARSALRLAKVSP